MAWVFYKESWIRAVIMTVLLICFASMTTCVYIMVQFFMLSPEEASKDPLYYVLMTRKKRDVTGHRWRSSVVAARVIVSMVGCSMVAISIYAFFVDGFPNPAKAFSPCVIGALIDNYGIITVLSVWIAYKESSYISAFIWIFLLLTNRSIITCVYIVWQLFHLSPRQPVSLILFNSIHKDLLSSDPLLEGV